MLILKAFYSIDCSIFKPIRGLYTSIAESNFETLEDWDQDSILKCLTRLCPNLFTLAVLLIGFDLRPSGKDLSSR